MVEVKDVEIPSQMQQAMAKRATAKTKTKVVTILVDGVSPHRMDRKG